MISEMACSEFQKWRMVNAFGHDIVSQVDRLELMHVYACECIILRYFETVWALIRDILRGDISFGIQIRHKQGLHMNHSNR